MPAPALRPTAEDRIRAALWFAGRGFGIFTVWSTDDDGTCRCPSGSACDNAGKHPVTPHGFRDATTDPDRITTLLSAGSEPNYGLVCPDGVFVLDVDGDGVARLAELEAEHGALPPTLRTNTAHGQHVFLRWPAHLPRPLGQMFGYVTRWGSGAGAGYVIGPRSVHATGAVYAPAGPVVEIAELPETWAAALIAPKQADPEPGIEVEGGYVLPQPGYDGSRYGAILAYTASRYMRGLTKDEVYAGVVSALAPLFARPLSEPELRSRFERAWKGTPERLGDPLQPAQNAPRPKRAVGPGMDAADLLERDLAPLRWIVPELVPEGTTILAAPPKVGKSCLVYQIAVEASIGGDLLGRRVTPGSVLYLALEDGQRRGQDRLRAALAGRTMPRGRLEVRWDARDIGAGLEDDIAEWLDGHPDAVLVAIDTLGKVRGSTDGRRNAYEVDVAAMARLQDLFRDRSVGLVIVHHARKESTDDFLTSVSGTYGITGSADTIVVIRRKRNEAFGTLHVTGRDVADAEISARFDDLTWTAAPGVLSTASFERTEVYRVIAERGPIFPKAIADELGMERTAVQHLVSALADRGAVARVRGGYVVAEVVIETEKSLSLPLHSSHSQGERESEGSEGGHAPVRAREGRCRVCRRVVELDTVGCVRPHYSEPDLTTRSGAPIPASGRQPDPSPRRTPNDRTPRDRRGRPAPDEEPPLLLRRGGPLARCHDDHPRPRRAGPDQLEAQPGGGHGDRERRAAHRGPGVGQDRRGGEVAHDVELERHGPRAADPRDARVDPPPRAGRRGRGGRAGDRRGPGMAQRDEGPPDRRGGIPPPPDARVRRDARPDRRDRRARRGCSTGRPASRSRGRRARCTPTTGSSSPRTGTRSSSRRSATRSSTRSPRSPVTASST